MFKKKKENTSQRRVVSSYENKPNFISYYANRQTSDPVKPKKQQPRMSTTRKIKWRHAPYILAGSVLLVCVLYSTFLNSKVRVLTINREMNLLREQQVYEAEANDILNSSIWNKNKLTINTVKFEAEMKNRFPELSRAALSLPLLGQRPVVELISEKPVLFLASSNGVYVIDNKGKVNARVNEIKGAGDLNLPTIRDEANIKVEPGKGALSSQDVTFITTVIKQFDHNKTGINSLILPPLASELRIKPEGLNYYVKFSLLTDPRIASGQYFALKKKLESEGISPSEYVDARVEEKVYYK